MKTEFYKYKNGKLYSTRIECFNKKVKCEFCHKEFNKTYLSKHIKRCLIKTIHLKNNDENNTGGTGGALRIIYNNDENHNDENHIDNSKFNRTLIVGPSFCGKTHLVLNKLQLIRLCDNEKQIHISTRSPEQYSDTEIEDIVVEEYLSDKSIQNFQNCRVVFDDKLDSNQKLIDPFFTRGRHNDLDVYYLSQSHFDLPKRTIRNNSNIIILFQQTLKDVEHIYRDIAGFDMSHDEFKSLCREAWKEKYNYLLINRLEDKNGKKIYDM